MRFISLVSLVLMGLGAGSAMAVSKADLDRAAADYFISLATTKAELSAGAQQLMTPMAAGRKVNHRCDDDQGDQGGRDSCVGAACDKLGTYGCDSTSEIREVGEACRGNRSGACMNEVCAKLGPYGCDSISEVKEVGQICRGNVNGSCMRAACDKLGPYGCDSISEVREVGEACQGASGSCVSSVCDRLGPYGCDSISEIREVTTSCRGG